VVEAIPRREASQARFIDSLPGRALVSRALHGIRDLQEAVRRSVRDGGFWLAALALVLPFEPRAPALPLFSGQVTLLEGAAAVAATALLRLGRGGVGSVLRRPPWPVALVLAYAGAHLLSAALAPAHRAASFTFALRMVAMAGFAVLVAAQPTAAWKKALAALAASGAAVAALAVAEGVGGRSLDPFLALFRENPFNVGGVRRATAGSEYPNLAAAFVMHGLVAGCALASSNARGVGLAAAGGALAGFGLLHTYSRGALVSCALALAALSLAARPRRRLVHRPAAAALAAVLGTAAAFAGGGEVFRLRLAAEGTGTWYGADYAPEEPTLRLQPGEGRRTRVRVTNTGTKTWTAREAFHLSYHWYQPERGTLEDGGRTVLPRDVAGGESVVLEAEVRAPRSPGGYLLVWDMVHEHASWFSGQGVPPAVVPATVSEAPAALPGVVTPPPREDLGWRPRRAELWALAASMWRERPLTGMGPDNFRRLYAARAGRVGDPRVYANNTLLEAAATTGTLGLVALAGALLASAAAAWRAARAAAGRPEAEPSAPGGTTGVSDDRGRVAAGVFALAVGVAAHGLVDYVLAFTGHYLLFGLVAGASAGLSRDPTPGGPGLAHP